MQFFEWVKHHFVPSHHNAYRPHLLRKTSLVFLLALALFAEGTLVFTLIARQSGHDFFAAVIQSEIVSLTNAERIQNKVATLAEDKLLTASAQAKADDMAKRGYFAHNTPDGSPPWKFIDAVGYEYLYAGENLAVRFVDSKDVVVAWMGSPTHRANIVKPVYTELGVGIAQGFYRGEPVTFVVQHFARPAETVAAVLPAPEPVAVASAPVAQQTEVLGAEAVAPAGVAGAPPPSFSDSLARQMGKIFSEPRAVAMWILSGIIALLALALAFSFVHHIQIQATDMLLPGAVVAAVAVSLFAFNAYFLVPEGTTQTASVAEWRGVELTSTAASIER